MSFDEDTLTNREQYPCPCSCGGNVEKDVKTNIWECDSCNWSAPDTKGKEV